MADAKGAKPAKSKRSEIHSLDQFESNGNLKAEALEDTVLDGDHGNDREHDLERESEPLSLAEELAESHGRAAFIAKSGVQRHVLPEALLVIDASQFVGRERLAEGTAHEEHERKEEKRTFHGAPSFFCGRTGRPRSRSRSMARSIGIWMTPAFWSTQP